MVCIIRAATGMPQFAGTQMRKAGQDKPVSPAYAVPPIGEGNAVIRAVILAICAVFGVAIVAGPALAHPHVWVTARAEILYGADGAVTGIRHQWAFDEAYSAFAVQGLDKNNDGKTTPDELEELAKLNVESLHEFGFFSTAKANGAKVAFAQPVDYGLTYDKSVLTLSFTLPLKAPMQARKSFGLEVSDETYFVAFAWADAEDAVRINAAPPGCTLRFTRPKPLDEKDRQRLSEDQFSANVARTFGDQFANKALVACP
jgi:ABC-type uncharacterized transport system substrate-binding protein